MALSSGAKLGPYEILSKIGAGGMGEVYRARDTRLERIVAVKVLPSEFSRHAELRKRLEREARTLSSLAHPHICRLYDVGQQDGADFLVMEYLEGETLGQRLRKGAFPAGQVLQYGIEIADALERAHRHGIIHRDLKPGNIMLTKDGAKLLDFGLARVEATAAPSNETLTLLETQDHKLTEKGVVLGTFQYMAPEQLEGKEADARTDIFALGAVIYEMATGKTAFSGSNRTSLITAILTSEPPAMTSLQPLTPPALERVVKTCLTKDPAERLQSAHDVKLQLQWIAEHGTQADVPMAVAARRRRREWVAWAVAAVLAIAAGLGGLASRSGSAPASAVRSNIALPAGMRLQDEAGLVLSPDGRKLAITATVGDKSQIYVRAMDSTLVQPLAGTEGATYPFWSPDSRNMGFFADGKLKRVPADGGSVQILCEAPDGRGGTWNNDDVIVFAPGVEGGLMSVSAAGGTPSTVTTSEGPSHRVPVFLPDGEHVLFYVLGLDTEAGTYLASLKSKEVVRISTERSVAAYLDPGYLLFIHDGTLMAQRFDTGKLKLVGDAVPIAEDLRFNVRRRTGTFSATAGGLLVYQSGATGGLLQITAHDMVTGKELRKIGKPGYIAELNPSPDGKYAIALVTSAAGRSDDLWLYDMEREVLMRFTFEGKLPGWSWAPDGKHVVYASRRGADDWRMYEKDISGNSTDRELWRSSSNFYPSGFSPDGKLLALSMLDPTTKKWGIRILPMSGDQQPYPFVTGPGEQMDGHFSPDGKWFTYSSDESGQFESYIVPFPGPGRKWQVGANASDGLWDTKGRYFYVGADHKTYRIPIRTVGNQLYFGKPQALLGGMTGKSSWNTTSSADGETMLAIAPADEGAAPTIELIANWPAILKTRK